MDLETLDIVSNIAIATILIPIALIIMHFQRQPLPYKWLAFILLLSLVTDIISTVFYRLHIPVNLAINIYAVINPVLFSFFFYSFLGGKKLRTALIIFNVLYILFSIINFAFIQKFELNSYSAINEKLLIMALSIVYFYKLLEELPSEKIYQIGLFWIVSGLFITHAAKLVLFSFVTYLTSNYKDNLIVLWLIHNFMSIICNFVMGWGVWVNNRQIKSLPRPYNY